MCSVASVDPTATATRLRGIRFFDLNYSNPILLTFAPQLLRKPTVRYLAELLVVFFPNIDVEHTIAELANHYHLDAVFDAKVHDLS